MNQEENEVWEKYESEILHESQKFEVSNLGRIKSYNLGKPQILKGYVNNGYLTFSARKKNKKRTFVYVHRAVAELFLEKPNKNQKLVIHLDHNRLNNHVDNLKWVTYKESEQHAYGNPAGSKYDKIKSYWDNATKAERVKAAKLSETQVLKIKKLVNDPNRKTRMRIIAKQFGVSVEQIYRIKSGGSWDWLTEEYLRKGEKPKHALGEEFLKKLNNG